MTRENYRGDTFSLRSVLEPDENSQIMAMFKYLQSTLQSMPFKTIMIKKSVYEKIKLQKREGESFSDLLERIYEEKNSDLAQFYGCLTEKEYTETQARMRKNKALFNTDANARERHVLSRLRHHH